MKEELSDFLKIAYKYGRVKDLEEAFEEFPVEEEWHKGKVENVLNEYSEKYDYYSIGDIVFVSVYLYPDGKMGSNHLFVIIDRDNTAIPIEYIGMILSSQIEKIKFKSNKLIKKDNKNNLNKDSIVKTDIVYKLNDKQILFKVGEIEKDKIEEYKKSFYDTLKGNNQ
ncbi:MAG: type II toxin-antitoxin system PemK/MazF family toxin [Clostridia bacterium]|nr:type II toxin-antitoxin system PemK/MazF family toxin [Clostridia bacterium]